MRIPISGFIIQSGDDESLHSHRLYITSWNGYPRQNHVHPMSGVTSIDDGHSHQYASWTSPAPTGVPHVHGYNMMTYVSQGHTHLIQGTTGPAIAMPGGGHYHVFQGFTTINGSNPHSHGYNGRTGNEVSTM
ncbi:YmaF-like protein [Paenibacillus taihuensis]|uniref:YmaF-like protein n=1 Tax=Paenibacillus taihuensis TaxID=1156355 RepID=A0A3D9SSD2_9BACL|nr:YmaF family protein [Paenibacillus taihuensis]REE94621.1 YmaF-like protein [Paenibacillus taihuensis]